MPKRRCSVSLVLAVVCLLTSVAWSSETAKVTRVVDGDTLVVSIAGREERVRLIGVDTPETVHPQKPVEFFGKEASAFTKCGWIFAPIAPGSAKPMLQKPLLMRQVLGSSHW